MLSGLYLLMIGAVTGAGVNVEVRGVRFVSSFTTNKNTSFLFAFAKV